MPDTGAPVDGCGNYNTKKTASTAGAAGGLLFQPLSFGRKSG
jgi:hypothetical protein